MEELLGLDPLRVGRVVGGGRAELADPQRGLPGGGLLARGAHARLEGIDRGALERALVGVEHERVHVRGVHGAAHRERRLRDGDEVGEVAHRRGLEYHELLRRGIANDLRHARGPRLQLGGAGIGLVE